MPYAVWHGTDDELQRLQKATQIHCSCGRNAQGAWAKQCGVHRLLSQQRLLDRLLFVRRVRDHFITREFTADDRGQFRYPLSIEPIVSDSLDE